MDELVEEVGRRLTREKRIVELGALGNKEGLPERLQAGFLGVSGPPGLMSVTHVFDASGCGEDDLEELSNALWDLVVGLQKQGPGVRIHMAKITSGFGASCLLFPSGIPSWTAEALAELKHSSFWKKRYSVLWAFDVASDASVKHRGAPLSGHPGHGYLRSLISDVAHHLGS